MTSLPTADKLAFCRDNVMHFTRALYLVAYYIFLTINDATGEKITLK